MPALRAHALHSQIDMHQAYGGWCRNWPAATTSAARASRWRDRSWVKRGERSLTSTWWPTRGDLVWPAPLLVGAGVACALGAALGRPVLGSIILAGVVVAVSQRGPPQFPFVALLVSGVDTQLMQVEGVGRYQLLGETIDDAAGEAFDKSATRSIKLMGLGYPAARRCRGLRSRAMRLPLGCRAPAAQRQHGLFLCRAPRPPS